MSLTTRKAKLAGALFEAGRALTFAVRFFGRPIRIHPSSSVSLSSLLSVRNGGTITIGKNCQIHPFAMLLTYGGDIRLGDNCSVNPFTIIYGMGGTRIGDGVRIAAHAVIVPENHNSGTDELPLYRAGSTKKGIVIEDNVWIGAGVRVLDGVRIGRNTIVGAGSVVTRSLPAGVTAMGSPARVGRTHQSSGGLPDTDVAFDRRP